MYIVHKKFRDEMLLKLPNSIQLRHFFIIKCDQLTKLYPSFLEISQEMCVFIVLYPGSQDKKDALNIRVIPNIIWTQFEQNKSVKYKYFDLWDLKISLSTIISGIRRQAEVMWATACTTKMSKTHLVLESWESKPLKINVARPNRRIV